MSWAAYTSFSKLLTEKVKFPFYYMQWLKTFLTSMLFCESFQRKVDEDAQSLDMVVWSGEATYKLSEPT